MDRVGSLLSLSIAAAMRLNAQPMEIRMSSASSPPNALSSATTLSFKNPLVSLASGGVLLIAGLRRGSALGVMTAIAGGGLMYRALHGEAVVPEKISGLISTPPASQTGVAPDEPEVSRSVTINRPIDEVFRFWSQPANFADSMRPFIEITQTGPDTSRWTMEGPAMLSYGWDSRSTIDPATQTIRWASLPNSDIANEGEIHFTEAPGDRGTEAHLRIRFDPPGGKVGEVVANHLEIGPKLIAMGSLRKIKSLLETGEVPTLEKNPSARGSGDLV